MKVRFLGSRGSIPTPGNSFSEYGGNTSCIQVIDDDGNYIILDAGSGIKNLAYYVFKSEKTESILLLTHFHWDHIMGIPFFAPFFSNKYSFTIYGPKDTSGEMYDTINNILAKDYFPVSLEQFSQNLKFDAFFEGKKITFGNMLIEAIWVNHPCHTLSYKITSGNKTIVYLTDHEPYKKRMHEQHPSLEHYNHNADLLHARLIDYVRGANVLIIEGEYTKSEYYNGHVGWGHSTLNDAIQVGLDAEVPYVVIHHHNQDRTDSQIKLIYSKLLAFLQKENIDLQLAFAKEGSYIKI
ncbi:MBL fold metallo-hydrolase [Brachyspira aalborgi]|uniref:MBL fold metallo-hydrolase n=1 Tax=Brachyspira aalborgi TaxID=29522 RepID=A0A5C8G0H9_9SPIR|nr:MBL fold metallo-hydrolase [Brachyspira aalborgi]TXJ55315.1 MBL fold metallo-hydrolase [Brachyspira aalborgi]